MTTIEQDSINFSRAVQLIAQLEPAFTVITGDFVHHADSIREWNVFEYILKQIPRRAYLVPGNHDFGNNLNNESLASYRKKFGDDYYTVNRQSCLFVMLNSQYFINDTLPEAKKQEQWLEDALNPFWRKPVHKFVFMHIPLYTEKPDEPDKYENIPIKHRQILLEKFTKTNVDYVITGHSHYNHKHKYENLNLVSTASTSNIIGEQAYTLGLGFNIFEVFKDTVKFEYCELDNPVQNVILKR